MESQFVNKEQKRGFAFGNTAEGRDFRFYLETTVKKRKEFYLPLYGQQISHYSFKEFPICKSSIETISSNSNGGLSDNLLNNNLLYKLQDIAKKNTHFILTGKSGSGKSAFLKYWLCNGARFALESRRHSIPVLLTYSMLKTGESIEKLLEKQMQIDDCRDLLQRGYIQVLFDGFKNISQPEYIPEVDRIRNFLNKYPTVYSIIASREANCYNRFGFSVYKIVDLDKSQIKQFVNHFLQKNHEKIFNYIVQDEKLFSFAANPHLLKILLRVLENKKRLSTKADLYYRLVLQLLKKKNFQYQTRFDINDKILIIGKLASLLRTLQSTKVPVEEVKKIFKVDGEEFDFLLRELKESHILQLDAENRVSFLHESYFNYFCALHFTSRVKERKKFPAELTEAWSESIYLSSELIENEQDASYLIHSLLSKPFSAKIKEYQILGFQNNLIIAAKCAHVFRKKFPNIYTEFERYLSNLLSIFAGMDKENPDILETFQLLYHATVSLSSFKLLGKIFLNYQWVHRWLYNKDLESIIKKPDNSMHQQFFEELCLSTFKYLNNSTYLYFILQKAKNEFAFSSSISYNISRLKKQFFLHCNIQKLQKTYKILLDSDLLFDIGKYDFNFLKQNIDFNQVSIFDYLDFIVNYYNKKEEGINELMRFLESAVFGSELWEKVIWFLFEWQVKKDELLEHLDKNFYEITSEKSYFQQLLVFLQSVDYEHITTKLRSLFHFELGTFCRFDTDSIFEASFDSVKVSSSGNWKLFLTETKSLQRLSTCSKGNRIKILVNSEIELEVRAVSSFSDQSKEKYIVATPLTENVEIIPKNGTLHEQLPDKELVDLSRWCKLFIDMDNPFQYHADLLINKGEALESLSYFLNGKKTNKRARLFINSLNINYLFHHKIDNTHYGIVIDFYKNRVQVFDLRSKEYRFFFPPEKILEKMSIEQIVSIEQSDAVHPITHHTGNNKIGYISSHIIDLSPEREEGFIVNMVFTSNQGVVHFEKDYFFKFNSCNFQPTIGDRVIFIPAKNSSKHYLNLPIAYRVQKTGSSIGFCRLSRVIDAPDKDYVRGYAIDLTTNETLYFKVEKQHLFKIEKAKGLLRDGDIFHYIVKLPAHNNLNKTILLLKQIESGNRLI